jgi:hypothetical protein
MMMMVMIIAQCFLVEFFDRIARADESVVLQINRQLLIQNYFLAILRGPRDLIAPPPYNLIARSRNPQREND